ncbi:MAG TPA: DUF3105 domain-containing protein [Solirubrobacterales bacterium]|nr:DUF3105 domain-containing protein [Solirubrobacterales bacterium]
MSRVLAIMAIAAVGVVACGDDDDDGSATTTTTAVADGPCAQVEEVDIGQFEHVPGELTAADYATNPPAWGDHNDSVLTAGQFYPDGAPFGHAVHLLEHGAVIGWTNELSEEDMTAVEEAFNQAFEEGYYQLAVIENPDLEVPFALSAWGVLQTCEELDTSVIQPFIEEWYASPHSVESSLACEPPARGLPPC